MSTPGTPVRKRERVIANSKIGITESIIRESGTIVVRGTGVNTGRDASDNTTYWLKWIGTLELPGKASRGNTLSRYSRRGRARTVPLRNKLSTIIVVHAGTTVWSFYVVHESKFTLNTTRKGRIETVIIGPTNVQASSKIGHFLRVDNAIPLVNKLRTIVAVSTSTNTGGISVSRGKE
jgi:hypothetical protein